MTKKKVFKLLGIVAGIIFTIIFVSSVLMYFAMRKVNTFKSKARQAEAKMLLTMAYTNQKMFQAEYNEFTSSLNGTEKTEPLSTQIYKVGFANELQPSAELKKILKTEENVLDPSLKDSDMIHSQYKSDLVKQINFTAEASKFGCIVEPKKFKLCAIGHPNESGQLDVWTLDENKILTNVQSGLE